MARFHPPLEKSIQAEIKRDLRNLGCHVTDFSQPRATKQTPGIPDLLIMHEKWRIALWVEVKRPGQKLTAHQRDWHGVASRCNVHLCVATCTTDVVLALIALGAPLIL
jgi:hypothetical protein